MHLKDFLLTWWICLHCSERFLCFVLADLFDLLQSGASSRAKHGGAYFSVVRRPIKDPIAVPGGHEVTGV